MQKYSLVLLFLFVSIFSSCFNDKSTTENQPNIVLIMADDMGFSDIGCFGGEIQTPNLDKLAAEGLRLTNFYNTGRCCPSRAALITGLYPHQTGVGDMLQNDQLPGYQTILNKQCVTLAEVLGEAGYHCMISGKWHLGNAAEGWPMKRGFHKQYASNGTTGHYFGIAKGRALVIEDTLREIEGDWIQSGKSQYKLMKNEDGSQWYATDAYTDRAIGYIKELNNKDPEKPFFLYLPYTAPHWPLHAFEEDIQKYQGKYFVGWDSLRQMRYKKLVRLGVIEPHWQLSEINENVRNWNTLTDEERIYYDRMMAVYAAMIDRMDQNIGRLIDYLRESGELDNTMILFFSDNGGCHEAPHNGDPGALTGTPESFDGYGYEWASVSNVPFRWFKHWTHEGGTSSPFIAWFPSMIKGGRIDKRTAHIIDIMPTLVDLTGAKYPSEYKGNEVLPVEGQSLIPLFKGETYNEHNAVFWEHEGNRAVRQGGWKLVSRFDNKNNEELPWELYNLNDDRSETNDLAKKHPDKVEELSLLYQHWADRVQVVPYQMLLEKRKAMKS